MEAETVFPKDVFLKDIYNLICKISYKKKHSVLQSSKLCHSFSWGCLGLGQNEGQSSSSALQNANKLWDNGWVSMQNYPVITENVKLLIHQKGLEAVKPS